MCIIYVLLILLHPEKREIIMLCWMDGFECTQKLLILTTTCTVCKISFQRFDSWVNQNAPQSERKTQTALFICHSMWTVLMKVNEIQNRSYVVEFGTCELFSFFKKWMPNEVNLWSLRLLFGPLGFNHWKTKKFSFRFRTLDHIGVFVAIAIERETKIGGPKIIC